MNKQINTRIRLIRQIRGFSQEYMAKKLYLSQSAYSKLERNQTKLDWSKIERISEFLEIDPIDLISFNEKIIFCDRSYLKEKLVEKYEKQILELEEEVFFLKKQLMLRTG